ncbi:MAG: hypothetical protein V4864_02640 [Pseudomonadota bacterium]
MPRWFLLLLILLLPLRGWVGEAMAGEMLARHIAVAAATGEGHMQHAADSHAHEHGHEHRQAPDHDCAGHAHTDATQADAQTQLPDAGCNSCASCQACSSIALGFAVPVLPVMDFGQAPPSTRLAHFASAEPRLGHKPPIS